MVAETLEQFMERKRNPKWKPWKAPKVSTQFPRTRVPAVEARAWDYRRWNDYRTILEPVTLEEFITRKSVPGWKAPKIPAAPGVRPPTSKQVQAEIAAWDQMVREWGCRHGQN